MILDNLPITGVKSDVNDASLSQTNVTEWKENEQHRSSTEHSGLRGYELFQTKWSVLAYNS